MVEKLWFKNTCWGLKYTMCYFNPFLYKPIKPENYDFHDEGNNPLSDKALVNKVSIFFASYVFCIINHSMTACGLHSK